MTAKLLLSGIIACSVIAACKPKSNSGPQNQVPADSDGSDSDVGSQFDYSTLTWTYTDVEVDDPTLKAGYQGRLLRGADGTLYYAYLKYVGPYDTDGLGNNCDIAVFGGGQAPTSQYYLKLATRAPGTEAWNVETVPLASVPATNNKAFVGALYGVDAAFDSNGRVVLAVAAGGPGVATCASSDLVLATRQAANNWSFVVAADDSSDCCSDCGGEPCTTGSDVGAWAAVARAPSGALSVAFVDYHFFWDQDGQTAQGYELWQEGGSVTGIRPWSGFGAFGALTYVDSTPLVAFTAFNGGGLWVLRRTGQTGLSSDWQGQDLRSGWQIGERISLAQSADGVLGLAAHAQADGAGTVVDDLIYCFSQDGGSNWSVPCENVDSRTLHLGHNPSLTFDPAGRAVVSYYYCGAGPSCTAQEDGVKLAWREGLGTWRTTTVQSDASKRTGTYSQLVIDPVTYEPTVVFQDLTRGAAVAAQGHFP